MKFCIFSYNRGPHLENCLSSIETCAPESEIIIYDDGSNDPETKDILLRIKTRHPVINTTEKTKNALKCGGLYNNMQRALEENRQQPMLCFLQDDMQLVRKIGSKDLEDINYYFERCPDKAFLHPAFLKGSNRRRDQNHTIWCEDKQAYFRRGSNQSSGTHFSAICILRTDRLSYANWNFQAKEPLNDLLARDFFGEMGIMKNPFAAWLPSVPAFRGNQKTIGLIIAEKLSSCGLHPFKQMSAIEDKKFSSRDALCLPIAEDYLSLAYSKLDTPWRHNALEQRKILKMLSKIQLKIRRNFSS